MKINLDRELPDPSPTTSHWTGRLSSPCHLGADLANGIHRPDLCRFWIDFICGQESRESVVEQ
jgi:hypothetical protein